MNKLYCLKANNTLPKAGLIHRESDHPKRLSKQIAKRQQAITKG